MNAFSPNKPTAHSTEKPKQNRRQCCHRKYPPKKETNAVEETKKERKVHCRPERRCLVLSKIYGETPEHYAKFEEEHRELRMGQLIKKYAEDNEITCEKRKKENFKNKSERRTKVLAKVYGGEPTQFVQFEEEHEDLRLGKLIQKYAEVNGINTEKVEQLKNKRVKGEEMKVGKLARFFSKPEGEYAEFVKEHPNLSFKRLLQELGVEVSREQLKEFRKSEKDRRAERRNSRKCSNEK